MQESMNISHPLEHIGDTNVTVWGRSAHDGMDERYSGRLCVAISTGAAYLHLRPTPAEARKWAALLCQAAEEFDHSTGDPVYECHITCWLRDAHAAECAAENYGWKTSQIARDPVLGEDTYFYLTCHDPSFQAVKAKMRETVRALEAGGVGVVRMKIEHVVFDTKTGVSRG